MSPIKPQFGSDEFGTVCRKLPTIAETSVPLMPEIEKLGHSS
jgi:hypothetical protein